jgi:DNA-binding response OmpR family regulator
MTMRRILVIDDDPKLSDLVRLFLEKTGRFEVCVENRSAQAAAAAREYQPDLIILDVDMPGKDGGDVARELAQEISVQTVPILFCTSLISPAETANGIALRGGMRYLAKPIDAKVLVESVDRVLAE